MVRWDFCSFNCFANTSSSSITVNTLVLVTNNLFKVIRIPLDNRVVFRKSLTLVQTILELNIPFMLLWDGLSFELKMILCVSSWAGVSHAVGVTWHEAARP